MYNTASVTTLLRNLYIIKRRRHKSG